MTDTSGFTISTDTDRIDLGLVHKWLSTDAVWALGRSRETVEVAARDSLNFGVFDQYGWQHGYARVVTDNATFAWLCDVYIEREFRGLGLGTMLAQTVVGTLEPMNLKRVLLSTLDAHAVYERVGFVTFPDPQELMQLAPDR